MRKHGFSTIALFVAVAFFATSFCCCAAKAHVSPTHKCCEHSTKANGQPVKACCTTKASVAELAKVFEVDSPIAKGFHVPMQVMIHLPIDRHTKLQLAYLNGPPFFLGEVPLFIQQRSIRI